MMMFASVYIAFIGLVCFNVSIALSISSKSLETLSSKTNQLQTKLYQGYLGASASTLARFPHGLDESKICSNFLRIDVTKWRPFNPISID
ncbi:unnamed protein product [Rotaria sordida]|uniref:Uncharacterized protein n=1 Tax=Rotaria sordida TaxID=392033 RepID=A0A814X3A5_9BILA|nr:unnamed protein product [Rotaria sordida]